MFAQSINRIAPVARSMRVSSRIAPSMAPITRTAVRMCHGGFPSRPNWGVNIIPANLAAVRERFGSFHKVDKPGLCFAIPFIDKFAYVVDIRERCIRIDPEEAFTKDNVSVTIGGNLYIQFDDPERAAYGAVRPIYASEQLAQAVMRTQIGTYSLNELFASRKGINTAINAEMMEGLAEWGARVLRFEITHLKPTDEEVSKSLHKQATAQRIAKETVLTAEAEKTRVEKEAEAEKSRVQLAAEAEMFRIKQEADAKRYEKEQEGLGEKARIEAIAQGEQARIRMYGEALESVGDTEQTTNMMLGMEYITKFGELAKESTSVVVPSDVTDLSKMISVGASVFDGLKK